MKFLKFLFYVETIAYSFQVSMPTISDKPPADTRKELEALSAQLDRDIPTCSKSNLLVAIWNIRDSVA